MNQQIEDYLAGLIEGGDLTLTPEIFTGTSASVRTPESHAVLVLADEIETVVASLYLVKTKVVVSSPTDDRSEHATMAAEVKSILEGTLDSSDDFIVGGYRSRSNSTATTDDGRWITTMEGVLGIEWTS